MGRKSNTEQRRAQIAQAMLAVMATKGYTGASITEIAKQAGLASGLIHYHFGSKQEILLLAVDMLVARTRQRYESECRSDMSARRKLEAFVHAMLAQGKGADADSVSAWVMVGAEAVRQAEVRAVYQAVIGDQLSLVSALLREAGLSKARSKRIAGIVLAAIEGAYQLSAAARDVMPRNYAAAQLKTILRDTLDAAEQSG